ncbi:exported hypothetical protein [Verrucomicrobia bacterium]|nr:exported hypothetical protein [Verrucomicrobiota bacterium]
MLGSTILEAATGLAFVYLLFSLFASAINEALLGHLVHLRARVLEDSLKSLLSNTGSKSPPIVEMGRTIWAMVSSLGRLFTPKKRPSDPAPQGFAQRLLEHPLVKGLITDRQACPTYLPASTFADAALATLAEPVPSPSGVVAQAAEAGPTAATAVATGSGAFQSLSLATVASGVDKLADDHAQKLFRSLLAGAKDLAEARERLMIWFNESMERVSGAYKRYTQFWLYVWATLIVLCLNVDTIDIARRLLADAQFRTTLADSATSFVTRTNVQAALNQEQASGAQPPGGPARTSGTNLDVTPVSAAQLQEDISNLKLPLGWAQCAKPGLGDSVPGWVITHFPVRLELTEPGTNHPPNLLVSGILSGTAECPHTPQEWWLKAFGLLITIGAVSQGAPFWFDLLNKVANLRAGGRPPKVKKAKTT